MTNLLNTIEMDFEYYGVQFENGWKHNAYTVELTHNGVTEEFDWKQGMGIHEEPDLENILESLLMDFRTDDDNIMDIYDDEEKAISVLNQLTKQNDKLLNLFTEYEIMKLEDIINEY
ncbi:hypothetical protein OZ71_gp010 [Staphylococcus phage MCE-2014]|uniref:Uncharacterized protein n=1 Tax=Staphylococcus phage MCE-2014 TaxID=1524910 RepID=A0A076G4I7_9CAUD|nr:hypothetical protein OZ71_gp010 [Staphylococcus phage MCE-2014]AII26850.1 hypothetical protein [Staphylococcus phage MCE-2014]